jgi:hypothetical protein
MKKKASGKKKSRKPKNGHPWKMSKSQADKLVSNIKNENLEWLSQSQTA